MNYFTADWHFFHNNIIKYCNRPFKNENEMRKVIIDNYNNIVNEDDTCFIVGDVAMVGGSQWEKLKNVINTMNGTKHLIYGNHDELKWQRYIDIGFTSVHSSLWLEEESLSLIMAHDPSVYCTLAPKSILICGHIHTLFKSIPKQLTVNVGVDMWDFSPITINQIKNELGI